MSPGADPSPALDARMRTANRAVAVAGATLAVGALSFWGLATAASVTVGAGLATLNLWALARIVSALLPSSPEGARAQSRAGWGVLAGLKLFGLVAVVWLLMRHGAVAPLPMAVGFGALPIGIAIGALVSDRSGLEGGG